MDGQSCAARPTALSGALFLQRDRDSGLRRHNRDIDRRQPDTSDSARPRRAVPGKRVRWTGRLFFGIGFNHSARMIRWNRLGVGLPYEEPLAAPNRLSRPVRAARPGAGGRPALPPQWALLGAIPIGFRGSRGALLGCTADDAAAPISAVGVIAAREFRTNSVRGYMMSARAAQSD